MSDHSTDNESSQTARTRPLPLPNRLNRLSTALTIVNRSNANSSAQPEHDSRVAYSGLLSASQAELSTPTDCGMSILDAITTLAEIRSNPRSGSTTPSAPPGTVYADSEDEFSGTENHNSVWGGDLDEEYEAEEEFEDDGDGLVILSGDDESAVQTQGPIHAQHSAQNVLDSDDPKELPFPDDRDRLVEYLERGLSLRHLFPKAGSEDEGGIFCMAQLVLIGAEWKRIHGVCGQRDSTGENYQRHIKSVHLRIDRQQKSVALSHIIKSWGYEYTTRRVDNKLRVRLWDPATQSFPLVESGELRAKGRE